MYRMIGFDLDGTLADTIPMSMKAFQSSVSPYAGHWLKKEEITRLFGLNEVGMVKAVTGKNWQAALRDFYQEYIRLHREEVTEPFAHILELLLFLKQQKVILILITGKGEKCCRITLKQLGLEKAFDEVLCGSETAPNKHTQIQTLLEKYKIEKEAFCYVGDAVGDLRACQKAGVICLTAAWKKSDDMRELKIKNPQYFFEKVTDLQEYLKQNL